MSYAVITDNEIRVSGYTYDNKVGSHYTFPHKYKAWLKEGTYVVYYKSRAQPTETSQRLSKDAHYFGVARIEQVYCIGKQKNNNMYVATIKDYTPFEKPVPFRLQNGSHYENDSTDWDIQSWRNGVRKIDKTIFENIVNASETFVKISETEKTEAPNQDEYSSLFFEEGKAVQVYSTRYERNPKIREKVIRAKGVRCCVCKINFYEKYGEIGKDFIHVHHNKPLASYGERKSNVKADFDVVCPNCHAMLHRHKGHCLSVEELRDLLMKKD